MLILTRYIGETIRIGDDVSLTVVGVQGNQVRIGADAPKEIAIHREEIYRRIQREKQGGNVEGNDYHKPSYDRQERHNRYDAQDKQERKEKPMAKGNGNSYNSAADDEFTPHPAGDLYRNQKNHGELSYPEAPKAPKMPKVIVKKRKLVDCA